MKLMHKQLFKQLLKEKLFILLLFLLTILTSLSFFFVMFSIDGNIAALNTLSTLNENQQLYKNALNSNTSLAYMFFVSLIGLTSFVFVLFFYRFYRANKKQIGCLKSLGFKDTTIRSCLTLFVAITSTTGALFGLFSGYYLSSVLINANTQTYSITGLVKGIRIPSLITGLTVSTIIFCIITFFCYRFVGGKEPGWLLSGNLDQAQFPNTLKIANKISKIVPIKHRFPLRIALRKPLAILLIFVAVMSFNVCIILGRSLNLSSAKVFESQTIGHNYEYDTQYSDYHTGELPKNIITYLDSSATLIINAHKIEYTITALNNQNDIYQLQDRKGKLLSLPKQGTVYISPELSEVYGVKVGEPLIVTIAGVNHSFIVANIAMNAKSANIYVEGQELANILKISHNSYNGILSIKKIPNETSITKTQRVDELNRNAVSNNISAVINQLTGGLVGMILIFLALYINFQDNTRDMLILNMMGHRIKNIRKTLVDVYQPIMLTAFIMTLSPSIFLTKIIQKSLSISTNDYMPFETNMTVILFALVLINAIYWLVQKLFGSGIKHIIQKEKSAEFIYAE